ncbi:N-6 DNA methylase [Brevundimonas sp. LjRoot202]|uniref:N-6 DNA methylase n=1 Tax=Brevundimonas sp. LjRoot202 TaxID=3342281 RepID=UPI003ECC9949
MLDSDTKRRINTCRDILVGKVPDPKSQVEQITIALIYKFMDDMDLEAEELGGARSFFTGDFERYRFSKLVAPGVGGQEMLNLYTEALTKMVENPDLPELFRSIFRNAYLPYRDPETLRSFLREINSFTYDHSERLGDAFEYLLSVLGSQGDAGQFRTPRHIIDFMVEIIDPQKNEVILDPACGTAGFLISAYKHILKQNTTGAGNGNGNGVEGDAAEQALESPQRYKGDLLSPDERARLARNIKGYDISPDMVRLSRVNMFLHAFKEPLVEEYDTLTSDDKWGETADVILANPPFMSPKGGIIPHNKFQVPSKRSEVLFVDYIAEHLTPNGRAAIVVPEGIIFQSQSAYVALRKMLVEGHLAAVISLPAGVFNPYSGVKTSILILDRALAKASKHVTFFRIENDGFALGAQRKAVRGSQLAQVKGELGAWLRLARAGQGETLESNLGAAVERSKIAEGGDYNLSGDRYTTKLEKMSSFPLLPFDQVCTLEYGKSLPEAARIEGPFPVMGSNGRSGFHNEFVVRGPGIVVGRKGSAGEVTWVDEDFFPIDTTYYVKLANPDATDIRYLYRVLRTLDLPSLRGGAGIPGLNRNDVYQRHSIPLPPLEVQREIVAEVEGYQRVIDGARAVIDNYRPNIPVAPDWHLDQLQNLVDTITPPLKLQTSEYGAVGDIPIIDQSQEYIAGWTTDQRAAINPQDGLVVFGDHTCAVKFVDRPFAQGADGIKILRPRPGLLPKFLAFYLQAYPLAQDGYRRHFSKLKEHPVRVPPLEVQQGIITEIEAEQALVDGNRSLVTRFDRKIDAAIAKVWGEATEVVAR